MKRILNKDLSFFFPSILPLSFLLSFFFHSFKCEWLYNVQPTRSPLYIAIYNHLYPLFPLLPLTTSHPIIELFLKNGWPKVHGRGDVPIMFQFWRMIRWDERRWDNVTWYERRRDNVMWDETVWDKVKWYDMAARKIRWCEVEWWEIIWDEVVWYDMIWYEIAQNAALKNKVADDSRILQDNITQNTKRKQKTFLPRLSTPNHPSSSLGVTSGKGG